MSINDEVMETLNKEGITADQLLFNPVVNETKDLLIKTDEPVNSSQETLTDDLKKRLLSPGTKYKTITDGVESIVDMEALQSQIATKGVISFADAEEVGMTFESFGRQISSKEFTKAPSKINFFFTTRFMSEKIKLKKESIGTQLDQYFSGPLADAEDAFEDFSSFYGKAIKEDLTVFQPECDKWLKNKKSISEQLFPVNSQFMNLASESIDNLPTKLDHLKDWERFFMAVSNLKNLINGSIHLKMLLTTVEKYESIDYYLSPKEMALNTVRTVSLVDFIKMFSNPQLLTFIQQMEDAAEKASETMNNLRDEPRVDPSNFEQVRDFVVEHGKEIEETNEKIHYYIETINLVRTVYPNISVVMEYFAISPTL